MAKRILTLVLCLAAVAFLVAAKAQRKQYDQGNCFHWKGCRGDSIGNMWVYDADRCKAYGGQSWMAPDLECYDFPDGFRGLTTPPQRE